MLNQLAATVPCSDCIAHGCLQPGLYELEGVSM